MVYINKEFSCVRCQLISLSHTLYYSSGLLNDVEVESKPALQNVGFLFGLD